MEENKNKSGIDNNNLLIVGNFSSDTGYAWDTILEYFLALGEQFIRMGSRALVCYPSLTEIPYKFRSTNIWVLEFRFTDASLVQIYWFIKRNRIRYVYFTDWPTFSMKYIICRIAGVRKIIVHVRTSGDRDEPKYLKRLVKTVLNRYPIFSADIVIGISEFVKKRIVRVSCFPQERTRRIWNGVDIERFSPGQDEYVYSKFKIPRDKKVIFAYSRANRYKGIEVLIDTAYHLIQVMERRDLFFLFCGDGPDLSYFRELISKYNLTDYFLCPGKTGEINRVLKGVCIVVVPSIWQEGFGLSVVEAMATKKVVIASRVGGIVEIIENSKNGYLCAPGESLEISDKIIKVIDNKTLYENIAGQARKTVVEKFNIKNQKEELVGFFKKVCQIN